MAQRRGGKEGEHSGRDLGLHSTLALSGSLDRGNQASLPAVALSFIRSQYASIAFQSIPTNSLFNSFSYTNFSTNIFLLIYFSTEESPILSQEAPNYNTTHNLTFSPATSIVAATRGLLDVGRRDAKNIAQFLCQNSASDATFRMQLHRIVIIAGSVRFRKKYKAILLLYFSKYALGAIA